MINETKRLEHLFDMLTKQADIAKSEGKDTSEIDKKRTSVLEQLIESRRNDFNEQFRLNMDQYDY